MASNPIHTTTGVIAGGAGVTTTTVMAGATTSSSTTTAAAAAVNTVVAELSQWRIASGGAAGIAPVGHFDEHQLTGRFTLLNTAHGRYFRWQPQTFGINLGWTDNTDPATADTVRRWFVGRAGADASPVRYGEPLALGYGTSPSYLRYSDRTIGINLEWSDDPVYEWELLGGVHGRPVVTGAPIAIYNRNAGTSASPGNFLVYFDRLLGGDIGWPDSPDWVQKAEDAGLQMAGDMLKKAAADALAALL